MTHEPPCMSLMFKPVERIDRESIENRYSRLFPRGKQDLIAETDFVQPVFSMSVENAHAKVWARGPTWANKSPAKTLQEKYQEQKAAVGFCNRSVSCQTDV